MVLKQNTLSIYTCPAEILQTLIRFNTTNPPGDEAEYIAYIRGLLTEAGIESAVLERTTKRLNDRAHSRRG